MPNGVIRGYTIAIFPLSLFPVETSSTFVTLSNLAPYTNYTITVIASTLADLSIPATLIAQTAQGGRQGSNEV